MKYSDITLNFEGPIYRNYNNNATIQFYNYPATVSDGTIFGTASINSDGTNIVGQLLSGKVGNYKFSNVPSGNYTVIASGPGISVHVIAGMEKYQIPLFSNTTGSDIVYKDNSLVSIATKIDQFGAISMNFVGDEDKYHIAPTNITLTELKESGTGTITFETSSDGINFTPTTLPITLSEDNVLKVSCTNFSTFKTIILL